MKVPREIEDKFFAGQRTEKTKFGINASVSILRGPNEGERGSVISVLSVEPQPRYLVELSNGSDTQIDESDMAKSSP